MNHFILHALPIRSALAASTIAATLALSIPIATAAPGAHGPGGEHLDVPTGAAGGSAVPRLEAKSEAFELVAELRGGELSILIDRYDTNEPVLGATLEVETGTHKATAVFHADHGDYAVADAAFLKALATPGQHALVFTLVAGAQSDLLDGTLEVRSPVGAAGADDHGHDHGDDHHALERAVWLGAGLVVVGLFGGLAWRRRGRSSAAALSGARS